MRNSGWSACVCVCVFIGGGFLAADTSRDLILHPIIPAQMTEDGSGDPLRIDLCVHMF